MRNKMNKSKSFVAACLLALGFCGQAQALPAASGLIINGTTFGSNDAFQFFNDSTTGENIVSLTWNLTPVNAFFDSTDTAPGISSSPLTLGSSSSVGHVFPTDAALNGQSTLTITFSDFNPGEVFRFGVDTDSFAAIDQTGLNGAQFFGATATVLFSDGSTRVGVYEATTLAGFGAQVSITNPSLPMPAPLFLLGAGLVALALSRRR
jgi:hypothetical protein